MSQPNKIGNPTDEYIPSAIHPSEHPFVDAIYRWFEEGKLDAAKFEQEGENQISWPVVTQSGFRIWHCLFSDSDGEVLCKSMVILGGIGSEDREKMLNKLLAMNRDWSSLYRFSIDNKNFILMEFCATTSSLSEGAYENLLNGLILWAERTSEMLKGEGFAVDRRAKLAR